MDTDVDVIDVKIRSKQQFLVTFCLEEYYFGLPIDIIQQIIPIAAITPLPEADEVVWGTINVSGVMIPIINMYRCLGLMEPEGKRYISVLLVRYEGQMVGLVVDSVLEYGPMLVNQIDKPMQVLPKKLPCLPLVEGLVDSENMTIFVLNLAYLLLPKQACALVQTVERLSTGRGSSQEINEELADSIAAFRNCIRGILSKVYQT